MNDTTPQTASGKVLWHFSMSLDSFVAGPNQEMNWLMDDLTNRPGLIDEYVTTTGAVLGVEPVGTWPPPAGPARTAATGTDRSSCLPTPKTSHPPRGSPS